MIYTILEGNNTYKEKISLRVSNKPPYHNRRLVLKAIKFNQSNELTFPERITFSSSLHYRFYVKLNKKR